MRVPDEAVSRIHDLYLQGLCLQAYAVAQPFGPFAGWEGTAARVMAGRLAMNVGAPRLGRRLHFRAHHDDPASPLALYYHLLGLYDLRGPLAALDILRPLGEFPGAPVSTRVDLLSLRARAAGQLRDFEEAEIWLARAMALDPDRPWVWVERAHLLEFEDRYEEALEAARRALAIRPWYRPGVQSAAHLLTLLGRDGESVELLAEAMARLESGPVAAQLSALLSELGRFAEEREVLERYAALSPLMEKETLQWLSARRSDAAYECGDRAAAAAHAGLVDAPFFKAVAGRLADPAAAAKRVLLPVGFVRQHHRTCAPATLSALSRFWSMPADHLRVAEAICYDGTPAHGERSWAEQNGWVAREFTVTKESATALIDRGVPFTLTTIEPGSGHLQAVIGYDALRGTLLVRDPFMRHVVEFLVDETLARYRSTGPRGMALVPVAEAARLEGLVLPDADRYDRYYEVQCALVKHDRPAAWKAYEALAAGDPGHRLTLNARGAIASYDQDRTEMLACTERLLGLYPDDTNLLMQKLGFLRDLARREERLVLLKRLAEAPGAPFLLLRQYAQELSADAREHEAALRHARAAARLAPLDGATLNLLAGILWSRREFEEALVLYRFAACLEEKSEPIVADYFNATRYFKRTSEALGLLESRFRRFGARSSLPARTLVWAYHELERTPEAFAVIDEALAKRPDDGELMLFAAEEYGRAGAGKRAAALLAAAEGRTPPAARLRVAAGLAELRLERAEALALWRQVIAADPLALDAHGAVARLLAETEGHAAAVAHLAAAADRFPHHVGLHGIWANWLRDDDPSAAEGVVRRILAANPADAWARRERAMLLGRIGRVDEGFEEADAALHLDPAAPSGYCVRGRLFALSGRPEMAAADYRLAIVLSVDTTYAIASLIEIAASQEERRESLAFVQRQLVRQVIYGDALLTYRGMAGGVLPPEELLANLREAHAARPDLWHAWAALVGEMADQGRLDEARDLARQATERFPLLPRLWTDRARVSRLQADAAGEREALETAVRINPAWGPGVIQLAEFHERTGDYAASRALLEQGVARNPLDARLHGCLAYALWQLDQREAALERVEHAVELDPDYEWAWGRLTAWSAELKRYGEALRMARDLTVRRGGEARSWLILARTLQKRWDTPEQIRALDRAIALQPRLGEAHDLRATLLAEAGRHDEALAACRPTAYGDRPPTFLLGRAAWVEAQRGRVAEAVKLMSRAVEVAPDYYWGWMCLAEWHEQLGDNPAARNASLALVRIAPTDPVAHGFVGAARLRLDDRAGAKAAFRRALELAPDYAFAGFNLFATQIQDGELASAAETLDRLEPHVEPVHILARRIRLALGKGDVVAAVDRLRALAFDPAARGEHFEPLHKSLQHPSRRKAADAVVEALSSLIDRADICPDAAALCVRILMGQGRWGLAGGCFDRMPKDGEPWRRSAIAFLETVGEMHNQPMLSAFIRRHREALRGDARTWGTVGYALATSRLDRACCRWLADAKERQGVVPWMLYNAALSLRRVRRDAEADAVGQHALSLTPDHTSPQHAAWAALECALRGENGPVEERLAAAPADSLDDRHRFVRNLALAVMEMRRERPDGGRAACFAAARKGLRLAISGYGGYRDDATLRRALRRAARRIARDDGGIRAWLWSLLAWLTP